MPNAHAHSQTTRRLRRRRLVVGLLTALGGLAAGSAVTAASPATTPPPSGEATPPDGLGDNPTFDALAESCYAGDLEACDDLYWGTEVGSAYEEYGSTCGGRSTELLSGDCAETLGADAASAPTPAATDLPDPTMEPTGLGNDPTLDALAQDCYAGGMFACDKLFVLGEEGTPYYDFGFSCAGRQALDSSAFCHELVGFPGPGVDFSTLPTPDDDNVLAGIASCTIGDMQACDDLYRSLDSASPYYSFADTCAGRQPDGTGMLCVNAFPSWEQLLVVPGVADPGAPTTTTATTSAAGEPTDPTGLGTDPTMDALAQSCFGGDAEACDDLFWRSPLGSAYETYGGTCGGRFAQVESGTCAERGIASDPGTGGTAAPAPTLEPTGLGDDPDLDALAQDCYAGAMIACDKLFFLATDAAPAYDAYGDTCAGRQPEGSGVFCHELVGFPAPSVDPSTLPTDDVDLVVSSSLCLIGDMQACDDLYRSAPADSPYSEFADTCAGRQEPGTNVYCTVAFPQYEALYETSTAATPTSQPGATTTTVAVPSGGAIPAPTIEPTGLGSDPTMDALAQACYGGDMQSCDDLFRESPLDSAYEAYGDTCAGRQPEQTNSYCTVSFPG